ncbi:uncharacterized protein LACBIDRAFT_303609 [Laccaria bicolor S238N-H82]|uniref:Predicted protein n=1 Tax=Laccaria bicolor (strain S238N-H82 / ATCC MYA-4686) TaxID=486041 RepID=B0DJU9_LACBS|nr:uncharacterized protein LACBIDRAFT_303609 [Laccaria bicolor S238N-H82]EDR05183.1 predicted protein [Laccaria bicolor S238N-H82]|eukprot:XP_001884148.1 predicted protein [Laccaria bicolor S238N-H82]
MTTTLPCSRLSPDTYRTSDLQQLVSNNGLMPAFSTLLLVIYHFAPSVASMLAQCRLSLMRMTAYEVFVISRADC